MLVTLTLFVTCFLVLAVITLFFSIITVTSINLFVNIFSLIVVYFCAVWLLALLHFEFLAFVILLVYLGAIAILFLFIIMMLPPIEIKSSSSFGAVILPVLFFTPLIYVVLNSFNLEHNFWGFSVSFLNDVEQLGCFLYTVLFFIFLLCGFILFIAVVCVLRVTQF